MYLLSDYEYDLPKEFIAQKPSPQRDHSRLLFMDRKTNALSHNHFFKICDFLNEKDVIVINNTEVLPGRLFGKKSATGGKAEFLILDYGENYNKKEDKGEFTCSCLIKASKRPKPGTEFIFEQELKAEVISFKDGIFQVSFFYKGEFESLLDQIGKLPLPPYIRREKDDSRDLEDAISYQTVYASRKGAVAAPTAGLHFSEHLLDKIRSKHIKIVAITLHVGYGTFLPVRVGDIRDHKIHSEWFSISRKAADTINKSKSDGGRVIAVGTTSVRTLEYASDEKGNVLYGNGLCDLYIYPGYRFKTINGIITNFHLPGSTLLMLVSAFAGREKVLDAYREAISEKYRFYSYGDAMMIV
jgi:S-adenosylmethionine:tRNA ribosyltransferase-isomerase